MQEQLEQFLAIHRKGHTAITKCAEILEGWGISEPTEHDIQRLKAELLARGENPHTVSNNLSTFRKFLKFVQEQEGATEQMSLVFDVQEREGLQDEPETPAVRENTSTCEENAAVSLEHEPVDVEPGNVEAHAMITGYEGQNEPLTDSVTEIKADTRYQSVEAVSQIVKSENKAKTQPRRGRQPKDEQERRSVKMSIYLTPKLYDGVEELASMLKQDVSEVVFTLLEDFVARNSEKMIAHQNFLASIGAIK